MCSEWGGCAKAAGMHCTGSSLWSPVLPCENLYSWTVTEEANLTSLAHSKHLEVSVHICSVCSHGDLDTTPSCWKQQLLLSKCDSCCTWGGDEVLWCLIGYSTQSSSASTSFKSLPQTGSEGKWLIFTPSWSHKSWETTEVISGTVQGETETLKSLPKCMTLLSDTFKQQSGGKNPCCGRNSSLQPLVDPCSDHKSTPSPWMKNGTCRNAGWGDECICVWWGARHFLTIAYQCDKKHGSGHPATCFRFYRNVLKQGKRYTTAARWGPQETSSGT